MELEVIVGWMLLFFLKYFLDKILLILQSWLQFSDYHYWCCFDIFLLYLLLDLVSCLDLFRKGRGNKQHQDLALWRPFTSFIILYSRFAHTVTAKLCKELFLAQSWLFHFLSSLCTAKRESRSCFQIYIINLGFKFELCFLSEKLGILLHS